MTGRSVLGRALVAALVVVLGSLALTGTASAGVPAKPCPAPSSVIVEGPPNHIAVTPDQRFAWVTGGGSVSVVDLRTRTVVSTIPVDPVPLGMTFNRAGTTAYLASADAGTVTVLDVRTRSVTRVLDIAGAAVDVAVRTSRGRDQLYVAVQGGDPQQPTGVLQLVDPVSGQVLRRWPIAEPAGVVLTRGDKLVAPSSADGDVLVVDPTSGSSTTVQRPDRTPTNPLSLSARGDTIVLPGDTTTWFDASRGTFAGQLPAIDPGVTSGSAITTDGRYTLLTTRSPFGDDDPQPGNVSVVTTRDQRIVTTVPVGLRPAAVSLVGDQVLVAQGPADNGSSALLIIPWKQLRPVGS